MALELNGTTGVNLVQDGVVTAADLAAGAARSNFGAGAVLQVVSTSIETNSIISSSTYTGTNLQLSITPSSATSKILVIAQSGHDTNASGRAAFATIFRDSTDIGSTSSNNGFTFTVGNNSRLQAGFCLTTLDSPATTSSVTYRVYCRSNDGNQIEMPGTFQESTMTLLEIAA
jgi:hypothetical protein